MSQDISRRLCNCRISMLGTDLFSLGSIDRLTNYYVYLTWYHRVRPLRNLQQWLGRLECHLTSHFWLLVAYSLLGDSWVIIAVSQVTRTSYSSPALWFYHTHSAPQPRHCYAKIYGELARLICCGQVVRVKFLNRVASRYTCILWLIVGSGNSISDLFVLEMGSEHK